VQETVGKDAELYGIDLNLAVIRRGSRMKTRSDLHLIVASLFAIPFERNSFDLVYSQGVLMMTYSTKEAVRSIAAYVKPGGYLFVWIYGLDDHLVPKGFIGLLARFRYWLEVFRPLVSESPRFLRNIFFGVLTPLTHPLIKSREHNKPQWKMKNTAHALRDWFSHRYAHRHSYNELIEWYEDLGFEIVDVQSPGAYRKLFGRRLAGAGLTGRKVGGTLASRTAQA
jgi:ubiquinone/menaquinone biosynthesis C-methylase UbiE